MAQQLTSRPAAASTDAALAARLFAAAAFLPILSAAVASATPAALASATAGLVAIAAYAATPARSPAVAVTSFGRSARTAWTIAIAGVGLAAIFWSGARWTDAVLHQPHDPWRADMLIVVQQAIRRLLQGRDPYAIYHVPWEAPLPYGPALWAPFVPSVILGVDVRVVTLACALVFPAIVVVSAARSARDGRLALAAGALAIGAAWLFDGDVARFMTIGHTPAYWPWIPLLVYFVAGEQWIAAAVVLGILCVARSTMVALVPVFAMAVWLRGRPRARAAAVALAASIALLLGPFAIWNWTTLEYGLVGSYEHVMKDFVWTSTQWVQSSVGVTGFLLRAHLARWVEAVQIAALVVTYAAAWIATRRSGDRSWTGPSDARHDGSSADVAGWMALALCVFSVTTLWPVAYIFFDVALLMGVALIARTASGRLAIRPAAIVASVAGGVAAVTAAMAIAAPADLSIDVGNASARRLLKSGFSDDEREGATTFAWVDGAEATVVVPRFSRSAAHLVITVNPAEGAGMPPQQMTVAMGGTTLGAVTLRPGWQDVAFDAPPRTLTAGANELKLFFRQSVSPREAGTGDDARHLAAAIDRIRVYSSARLVPSS